MVTTRGTIEGLIGFEEKGTNGFGYDPLLYVPEYFVRSFAKRHELPIVHNPCPADGNTKRQEIKELLKNLETTMPGLRERIFGAMQRYPLDGWAPDRTRKKPREKK